MEELQQAQQPAQSHQTDETQQPLAEEASVSDGPVQFDILAIEKDFVAIRKPAGFHVHQPEFPRRRVPDSVTCLSNLRRQIGQYVYPVHRIDVATDGVLIFGLSGPAAGALCRQFQNGLVEKTYFAIVRGWVDDSGVIDVPLALDSTGDMVPALTRYHTHARAELPFAVGKRHASVRYSLVEAWPETGRFHQIRRHFARRSHPLLGDAIHGDSHHNRFFREHFQTSGLWLKAHAISFNAPFEERRIELESPWGERWQKVLAALGWSIPQSVREAALAPQEEV